MPAHFTVATHEADPVSIPSSPELKTPEDLLRNTWGQRNKVARCEEFLQSSVEKSKLQSMQVERNGLVDTIVSAYNNHHHLTIRPDDVWMAILCQFNFYVNAHAEELRSHFVLHQGKKEVVVIDVGTRYTVDFGILANRLSNEIQKNVVDKDLRDWILPNFSTTTHHDTVICSVLMMATLNAYFDRKIILRCGIPSVTLEGEKEDWEKLLSRLDKLSDFGAEPTAWAALLRPILTRFLGAFDGEPDIDFWGRVCHVHPGGSGPSFLSGWITAFCVWTSQGEWQGPSLTKPLTPVTFGYRGRGIIPVLSIDEAQYSAIDTSDIPIGFCEVDIKLDDNGQLFECMMVAGHLASAVEGDDMDSLRPAPTWFMFIKAAGWA